LVEGGFTRLEQTFLGGDKAINEKYSSESGRIRAVHEA